MMIFAIDDEPKALTVLCRAITEAASEADLREFDNAADLLAAVNEGTIPDVLFSDADMPGMSGVELARRLKRSCPNMNVIFATAYDDYMRDALSLHVSGYLKKPITTEDVRTEMENLRHPIMPAPKRVRFQCFGNFEIFIDGVPMSSLRGKTKEYLAYLVDRGTLCTGTEIAAALWTNDVSPAYIRKLRKELTDTFAAAGCEEILIHEWHRQGIRTDLVDCDYYDWKKGRPWAFNAYHGEYMSQYSWAEMTHGMLEATGEPGD